MHKAEDLYQDRKDNRILDNFDGDYGYPLLGKTVSLVKDPYSLILIFFRVIVYKIIKNKLN